MDILFEPSEWLRMKDNGYNPFLYREYNPNMEENELHKTNIRRKLATRLSLYLNEEMKREKLSLQ